MVMANWILGVKEKETEVKAGQNVCSRGKSTKSVLNVHGLS